MSPQPSPQSSRAADPSQVLALRFLEQLIRPGARSQVGRRGTVSDGRAALHGSPADVVNDSRFCLAATRPDLDPLARPGCPRLVHVGSTELGLLSAADPSQVLLRLQLIRHQGNRLSSTWGTDFSAVRLATGARGGTSAQREPRQQTFAQLDLSAAQRWRFISMGLGPPGRLGAWGDAWRWGGSVGSHAFA